MIGHHITDGCKRPVDVFFIPCYTGKCHWIVEHEIDSIACDREGVNARIWIRGGHNVCMECCGALGLLTLEVLRYFSSLVIEVCIRDLLGRIYGRWVRQTQRFMYAIYYRVSHGCHARRRCFFRWG